MPEPARPLLVYDGDCGFCLRWIERWRALTGERVEYAPYQRVAARLPDVPPEDFLRAVHLVEPDGRRSRAAEAVFRSLARAPGLAWIPWLYRALPGVRPLSEAAYRFVADHRAELLRLEHLLVGRDVVRSRWSLSRAVFRCGLALVALIALLSLWVQLDGLAGRRGILPVEPSLAAWTASAEGGTLAERAWNSGLWRWRPTLAWLDASDAGLHRLCAVGVLAAVLLLLDVAPALCALTLWAAYLSLTVACGTFLSFQWDSLLVETLLLAVWLLPWRLRPGWWGGRDAPAPLLGRLLLWWLLFRFMFESGVVKLSWGDPT
jgi:predicted DCC family thiol-disulfide oxidoreductase YuxK